MHRVSLLLSVIIAVLLSTMVALPRPPAGAQEATSTIVAAMAAHPVVVGWRFDNDPANPGTSLTYGLFHADGTYVEIGTDGVTSVGVWQPTGERTADLTVFFADIDPDPEVVVRGEWSGTAEVDEAGTTLTLPNTFVARDTEGNIVFGGDFQAIGTRLAVTPMVPFAELAGTPSAATPVAVAAAST